MGEFGEDRCELMPWVDIRTEFVVATTEVLDERVPGTDHPCRCAAVSGRASAVTGLEAPMIGFDGVIRILLGDVTRGRYQLLDHPRVGRRPIGGHLGGPWAVLQDTSEEPAGGGQIPFGGDQHIDDLAVLVDRPIQINPPPGDFHIRLIHKPTISRDVPAGTSRIDQQRSEPLHPSVDGQLTPDPMTDSQTEQEPTDEDS
jgi:hypothetical protein